MSSDYLPQLDYGQSSDDAVAGSAAATQAADETTTVAGLDSSLLDTLLRRFTAVDFSNEPVGNNSGAGAAPTQRAASTASQAAALAGSGGPVKSALKNRSRGGAKAVDPVKAAAAAAAAEQDARLAAANRAAAVAREQAREARASAALRGVEWMLDNTASSEAELRAHALGALTAAEFAEATQERALASVCGNPLCSNALTRPADVGAMRLSSSKKVAYRVQAPVFCGPACALRARDIQATLPQEISLGDALEPVTPPRQGVQADGDAARPSKSLPGATGPKGAVTMSGTIVERPTVAPAPLAPPPSAATKQHNAVEGYIPRSNTQTEVAPPVPTLAGVKQQRHVQWRDMPGEQAQDEDDGIMDDEDTPGQAFAEEDTEPIVLTPSTAITSAPPASVAAAKASVAAAVSFAMPERLRASDYQAKVDRALAAASERALADAAAAAASPSQADGEDDAAPVEDDVAFVRSWMDVSEHVDDGPSHAAVPAQRVASLVGGTATASAIRPPSIKPLKERRAAQAAKQQQQQPQPISRLPAGAVFMFQTMGEGTFGPAGTRKVDPEAMAAAAEHDGAEDDVCGSGVTNMGQYAFGQLTALRDEDEEAAEVGRSGAEHDGESSDEEEKDVHMAVPVDDDDDLGDLDAHVHGGHGWPVDESDDDSDGGEVGAPGVRVAGAHPLYEQPGKETRPSLSPFLQLWTCLDEWLTPASIIYLSGGTPPASTGDSANTVLPVEGVTPEEAAAAARRAPPLAPGDAFRALQALASHINTMTPRVRRQLQMHSPQGPTDAAMHGLLTTFALRRAVPSLSPPLWTVFLLLVYEPLGRHRVPALGVDLATEAAHKSVRTIVQEAGFSPEQYRTLRELLSQGNQTAA